MAFLDADGPLAFAHRGFALEGDENSMAAFQRAVDLGYRYLETDVQVTRDGVALAFHDSRLDRVTDARGKLVDRPWTEVRAARISGREPIPLLTDVLTAWPDVRINIDVKSAAGIGPTVDAIRRTGSLDRVCIASFAQSRIAAVRQALGPGLCTSLGPGAVASLRAAALWPGGRGRAPLHGAACAQVPAGPRWLPLVDERLVATAHRLGLQVHVWTINDRAEMVRLLDLGVDGLVSDRADVLREVLIARGQWSPPPAQV